jgi:hypothetical protein
MNHAITLVASRQPIGPDMDVVGVLGFMTAILTLLFFMHQRQSSKAVLGLAICLAAMSLYGLLQGAWPLGLIELVWSVATLVRWRAGRGLASPANLVRSQRPVAQLRLGRLFGESGWN